MNYEIVKNPYYPFSYPSDKITAVLNMILSSGEYIFLVLGEVIASAQYKFD